MKTLTTETDNVVRNEEPGRTKQTQDEVSDSNHSTNSRGKLINQHFNRYCWTNTGTCTFATNTVIKIADDEAGFSGIWPMVKLHKTSVREQIVAHTHTYTRRSWWLLAPIFPSDQQINTAETTCTHVQTSNPVLTDLHVAEEIELPIAPRNDAVSLDPFCIFRDFCRITHTHTHAHTKEEQYNDILRSKR